MFRTMASTISRAGSLGGASARGPGLLRGAELNPRCALSIEDWWLISRVSRTVSRKLWRGSRRESPKENPRICQLQRPHVKTHFGPFTLDSETRRLLRDDEDVHLPRKAFELLSTLLTHRPKVLGKDELHAAIWPDSHVDAAGLNVLVGD